MALYVIDATLFKPSSSASVQAVTGGEAFAVGDALYRDATLDQYFKVDADSATPAAGGSTAPNAGCDALAASACAGAGCRAVVVTDDPALVVGATTTQVLAAGDVLVAAGTAGKIQPAPADTGDTLIVLGVATSATVIKTKFVTGGVTA